MTQLEFYLYQYGPAAAAIAALALALNWLFKRATKRKSYKMTLAVFAAGMIFGAGAAVAGGGYVF